MERKERCGNCNWWECEKVAAELEDPNKLEGGCHGRPPQRSISASPWPRTQANDFCAGFKGIPQPRAKRVKAEGK